MSETQDVYLFGDGDGTWPVYETVGVSRVLTVDQMPDWASSECVIRYRGGKLFLVSQTQIPRWKHWLNKLKGLLT